MRPWIVLFILLLASPRLAEAGIPRWDALPAVDVMHLQGPYAGRSVCPMCQHGYDAGVLVFLPSAIDPASAFRIARQLRTVAAKINDPRFRPFLILTGATPSPELLAAVKDPGANWYVAHLAAEDLPGASRDFKLPLAGRTYGYVFSQRRLLASFDPQSAGSSWTALLARYADYAMSFLRATQPNASKAATPDTPKGRLWLAPDQLSSTIAIAKSANRATSRLCFVGPSRSRPGNALVALSRATASAPARVWWGRTNLRGCLEIQGAQAPPARVQAEVFSALQPPVFGFTEVSRLVPGTETEVVLHPVGAARASASRVTGKERVVGLPCEGCEHVFTGLPNRLSTTGRIAASSEPGEPLRISGTVRNAAGVPQSGVVVYAYQTDRKGSYPLGATRHGGLRGWARSDANGKYRFTTIRPGAYPKTDIPQHVHMHLIEPGRCTYYIGDTVFTDDPHLTTPRRLQEINARGGSGITRPEKTSAQGWTVTRDITLGMHVPGYDDCAD